MLTNRLIPLARLPFLSKGFATTLPYGVPSVPSALCTCSACSGSGAAMHRADCRSNLLYGSTGTTWSWLRHAHDQRQGPPGEPSMDAALSSHLAQDAQRLANDPVTMLMSARGIPLGVVMHLARDVGEQQHEDAQLEAQSTQCTVADGVRVSHTADDEEASVASTSAQARPEKVGTSQGAQVLEKLLAIIASHSPAGGDQAALQHAASTSGQVDSQPAGGMSSAAGSSSGASSSSSGNDGDDAEAEDAFLDSVGATLQKQQAESISALKEELRNLEEVFEVLAEVPWLDDAEPEQAEKKDLLRRVLVSALEERGWQLRAGLESIWQGERDPERVAGGAAPRERLALASILFHVQQLEAKFGLPEQASRSA